MRSAWNGQGDLAGRLRAARGDESQASLAARSGISARVIGQLEQSKLPHCPRPATIARLAIATGQDPTEWLKAVKLRLDPHNLSLIADTIGVRTGTAQLKPALVIERELQEWVESRYEPADQLKSEIRAALEKQLGEALAHFELPQKLRLELKEHTDARVEAVTSRLRDLEARLEQVAQWQREIVRDLSLANLAKRQTSNRKK